MADNGIIEPTKYGSLLYMFSKSNKLTNKELSNEKFIIHDKITWYHLTEIKFYDNYLIFKLNGCNKYIKTLTKPDLEVVGINENYSYDANLCNEKIYVCIIVIKCITEDDKKTFEEIHEDLKNYKE